MLNKNIITELENNNNIAFFCDISLNNENFHFTTHHDNIKLNETEHLSGIDDFLIQFEKISQHTQNWIKIALKEDILTKFAFINSGKIKIFVQSLNSGERHDIFNGIILNAKIENQNLATIAFSSYLITLSQEFGDFFSKTCRAEFGDSLCKKDLTSYTFQTKVLSVNNQYQIKIELEKEDGFFTNGYAILKSENLEFKTKILIHVNNILTILSLCPFKITENLDITLILPCGKTISDCKKFNNIVNFRGEPFIAED